jgi:hypothetical protein
MKKQLQVSSNLALETARTREEHTAVFKQYGVLWWWRLKPSDPDSWSKGALREKVSEKGSPFEGGEYSYVTHSFSVWFRYRYERSAFEYERLARVNAKGKRPQFELGKPWSALTQEQWNTLSERWPMAQSRRVPYVVRSCTKPWPNECVLGSLAFNLEASSDALASEFKKIIQFHRERLKIAPTPKKGRRMRPYPWRALELWDLVACENKTGLSPSERSMLSRARRL